MSRPGARARLFAWSRQQKQRAQAKAMTRFGGPNGRQAYKSGYAAGWHAGIRYMQRWGSGSPAQEMRGR
jgi:uncharacterized protein YjaZ